MWLDMRLCLVLLLVLQVSFSSILVDISCPVLCVCRNNEAVCEGHGKKMNYIPPLPSGITSLTFRRNHLSRMRNNVFENISHLHLTKLVLRRNRIDQVDKTAFRELPYLQSLDLSGNKLHAKKLKKVVYGLQNGTIQELYLTQLHMANMSDDFFLQLKTLRRIYLDDNVFYNFCGNLLSLPQQMQLISLTNNQISTVEFKRVMPNMEVLNLRKNKLLSVPKFCFSGKPSFPKLKVLHLSDNLISVVWKRNFMKQCLPNLQILTLGFNKIQTIVKNFINDLSNLQYLSIENLAPGVTVNEYSFNSSSLMYLYMANKMNIMRYTLNIFQYCRNLEVLDMTGIQLNSSHNLERKLLNLLRPLTKLQELVLKGTSVTTFPKTLFTIMPNLRTLSLQNCFINESHLGIFSSTSVKLKTLLLDYNLITTLNKTNLPAHIEHISLKGNPFLCTCDLVWFRDWIQNHSHQLLGWPKQYVCHLPQEWIGRNLADFHLSFEFCHPFNAYILVAISVSFAVFIIVIVSCVLYQKRWHIKYYLYLLRAKRRGYEILGGDEFAYDVFVAYNSDDRIWVISEIVPKLEKEEKFKLCLHDRDFQVGKLIVDNITDTMHRSRKILIVLSNSFAQSHWCRFETMLAQLRTINKEKEMVIVIILENILTKNMTNSLHVLLKTTTFIEWTNEKSGKEMFWNRVISAIKS
ncbi:toll-like receptor 2 [Saccostrea cucullata]|uniref:toll-like receptor 2 n=1 Tax=Saccostrea cuccullata TaxID=36930 RepID=UPI002ED17F47